MVVHVLYKGPEIPANAVIPEFAISATCRKHEKVENPGSIPVSATKNHLEISALRVIGVQRLESRSDSRRH